MEGNGQKAPKWKGSKSAVRPPANAKKWVGRVGRRGLGAGQFFYNKKFL